MKLTHQKENTHTHTHRARNHRAYQLVVIEQTRIVQNSRQRGNELVRRGNIGQRGEKEGGSGSRELKLRGPGWWEDGGRGGEAGLPVPSAAADFWEGRKSTAGLGLGRGAGGLLETSPGRRGGPGMFQNPYGTVETAIYHTGPRVQAWEGSFLSSCLPLRAGSKLCSLLTAVAPGGGGKRGL